MMPSISASKKEAILQLCNFLCTSSVTEITELADGEILLRTIQAKFPQFVNSCHNPDVKSECLDVTQSEELNNAYEEKEIYGSTSVSTDTDINFRFKCIQKFIDQYYGIESCQIISYSECEKQNEFEVFKVAIFVLSEIVKHLFEINQEHLQTLYHLDVKYQVELEDFFKVLISDRRKICKDVVEKLFSKKAAKSTPFLTPTRQSPRSKQQKTVSPPTQKEDIFSNSPLKEYFDSPIFKKEDILVKERQIKNLEKVLEEGDEEKLGLLHRITEVEKKCNEEGRQNQKLQKEIIELKSEIKFLQDSFLNAEKEARESKAENKKLVKRIKDIESENKSHIERLGELNAQLDDRNKEYAKLEKIINEERKREKLPLTDSATTSNSSAEYKKLKKRINYLEFKVYGFKKQLSRRVLAEVKSKDLSGNYNKEYEAKWAELDKERKEIEENLAKANGDKEDIKIEHFEEKASDEMFTSFAIQADLPVRECKTPETEKLRKSISDSKYVEDLSIETSYNLNNSGNLINDDQSIVLSKAEICPEKPPEASLWIAYDLKPENTDDINFSQECVQENSQLDQTNNLEMNYARIENTESDVSLCQENKFVFGNLNFNVFLNKIKKLTKNGSFQKVLQVFEEIRKTKGSGRSNSIDIQELLKIVTECISIVSLNAKSFPNLQDKCCSTENDFKQEKIRNEKCDDCEKLKEELKELNYKKAEIESDYKAYRKEFSLEKKSLDRMLINRQREIEEYENLKIELVELRKRNSELMIKIKNLKETNAELMMKNKQYLQNVVEAQSMLRSFSKRKGRTDTLNKLLKEQNSRLKQEVHKLKEIIKEKEEKESMKLGTWATNFDCKGDERGGEPSSLSVTEFYSNNSQDTANESQLSAAYHKNLSHYVSENEDDFVYINSLTSFKESLSESRRVQELKRRNSLLPIHLQSAYPVESNLNAKYESLYVKNENSKEENCSKKRKLDDPISEEASTSFQPNFKIARKFKSSTPKKLSDFVKKVYNNTHKK